MNIKTDYTVINGHAKYSGRLVIKDGVTTHSRILYDGEGERQFLADAVEAMYREYPDNDTDLVFKYDADTKELVVADATHCPQCGAGDNYVVWDGDREFGNDASQEGRCDRCECHWHTVYQYSFNQVHK